MFPLLWEGRQGDGCVKDGCELVAVGAVAEVEPVVGTGVHRCS